MHCIIFIKHQENPSSFHLSLEMEKLFLTLSNPSSSAQSEPSLYETQSSIYRGNNEDEDKVEGRRGKGEGQERKAICQIYSTPEAGLRASPIFYLLAQLSSENHYSPPSFQIKYVHVIQVLISKLPPSKHHFRRYGNATKEHMLKGSTLGVGSGSVQHQTGAGSILGTRTTRNGKTYHKVTTLTGTLQADRSER